MVTFAFGELTNLLHEAQCLAEIPELEGPLDPFGIVAQLPLRDLLMKAFSLLERERRDAPLTRVHVFPTSVSALGILLQLFLWPRHPRMPSVQLGAMPLSFNSLSACLFFDRCDSPMPRSTCCALVNWMLS